MVFIFVALIVAAVLAAGAAITYVAGRVRVQPGEALIISGREYERSGKQEGAATITHRVVSEGEAFRLPFLERVDVLPVASMTIDVDATDLRDADGFAHAASVTVSCRISVDEPFADRAIVRFLGMDLHAIEAVLRTAIESLIHAAFLESDPSLPGIWPSIESRLKSDISRKLEELGVIADRIVFREIPDVALPTMADGRRQTGP